MLSYRQKLYQSICRYKNFLCLGFDLNLTLVPSYVKNISDIEVLRRLCFLILDVFSKKVPAVKFQIAFFESKGWQGLKILEELSKFAKEQGLLVIIDAKRGDISTTMKAYGQGLFDVLQADAITISPYMGQDTLVSLKPWLQAGKGIYLLGYTSNQSGVELQSQFCIDGTRVGDKFFSQSYSSLTDKISYESIGAVIGANSSGLLSEQSFFAKQNVFSLVPGVGAQRGSLAQESYDLFCTRKVDLVPVSRSLIGLGCMTWKNTFENFNSEDNYRNFLLERARLYVKEFSLKD
jgi:orotidine-5'-phosphate decarboxylase